MNHLQMLRLRENLVPIFESYGQIKTDTCWSFYWDTEALFPLFLKQYDNNINQLHYYEPQKILEGTFEAGSYPEMNDCLT